MSRDDLSHINSGSAPDSDDPPAGRDKLQQNNATCEDGTPASLNKSAAAAAAETFDDLLELAGGGGRFQVLLVLATSLAGIATAFDTFSIVFKIDQPEHWCIRDAANNTLTCAADAADCPTDRCRVIQGAGNDSAAAAAACVEWAFDHSVYTSTAVTDFQLVCGRSVLRSLTFTVQMLAGLTASLLFGLLGDWYGRARAAAGAVLLFIASAALTAAAPNLPVFMLGAAVSGAAHFGLYICLFTLCMESIGDHYRSVVGLFWVVPWAAGIMLTAAGGWLLRSWWQLQLMCAGVALPLLPGVRLLPESPRWLAARGRSAEAAAGLRQIARGNGRQLPADIDERLARLTVPPPAGMACCREIQLLLSSRRMAVLTASTVWLWFVMAVVYYGISFDAAQLADDAYLAMLLAGLVELPSMAAVPLIDRCGRRPVVAAAYLLAAAAILLVPAVSGGWPLLLLGLLGKLAIGAGFGIIYIHLEEYMPTEVRNAALGLSTMAESVGGALCPHVAFGLGGWHWAAPSVVFGVLAVSAGVLTLLTLPETAGQPLPETVRDVLKSRRRGNGGMCCCSRP